MKKNSWVLLVLIGFLAAGCAQKTETEKLGDQLKRASTEWQRESEKVAKDLTEETNKIAKNINREIEEIQ